MRHRKTAGGVQDNSRDVSRDEWNDRHVPDTRSMGFFNDFFAFPGEGVSPFSAGGGTALASYAGGALVMWTGGTATGRSGFMWPAGNPAANVVHELGAGEVEFETRVRMVTASDATNAFLFRIGLTVNPADPSVAHAVLFEYDPVGRGNQNWWAVTRRSGMTAAVDSGVLMTPAAFQTLRFDVAANASAIVFRIDGAVVRTETTVIPSGTGMRMGHGASIMKSVGTANREALIDYFSLWQTPISGRPAT